MSVVGLLLAVLIGISLGFFGGGGSILTVPLLAYVFGLEPKVAIASSLLVVAVASLSGALQHARAGNLRLRTALVFGVAGMLGAYAGGRGAAFFDGSVLLMLFAAPVYQETQEVFALLCRREDAATLDAMQWFALGSTATALFALGALRQWHRTRGELECKA